MLRECFIKIVMKYEETLLIDDTFVFPDEQTIYIFGAGVDAETAYKKINKNVAAFIDNYRHGEGFKFYGKPIISFDTYMNNRTNHDLIIIATYRFSREISEQLNRAELIAGKDYYIWDEQYLYHEDDATEKFIHFMEKLWSPYQIKKIKDDARVLIPFENRHDTAAIVYAYCGNFFAKKFNARIEAYLRYGISEKDGSPVIKKIYRAFNVNNWVDFILNEDQNREADELIENLWKKLYSWEDWKKIHIYNIHFGTTIIRHFLRVYIPTFDLREKKMYDFLKLAVRTIVFWYHYINANNFKVVLLGDGTNWDGYIRDIAIDKGIPAYALSYVVRKLNYDFAMGEPYLYFDKMWGQLSQEEQNYGIQWAKEKINRRLEGDVSEVDPSSKNKYSFNVPMKESRVLDENDKLKIVIFPHIFEEDSYYIGEQIFDDNYFSWLCHLGELSEKTPSYDWYLKIHPCASRRDYIIYDMIVRKYPKIKCIKTEISPFQLKKEGVKFALTVCGTIGQEYPAIGIQVINAGLNPYICFSFTHNPRSKKEFDDMIMNLDKLDEPGNIEELYKFYAINHLFYNWKVVDFKSFFDAEELTKSYDELEIEGKEIGTWRYTRYMDSWNDEKHRLLIKSLSEMFCTLDSWRPDILYRK